MMKKFLVLILFAIAGTTVAPSDAQAFWHGRFWGGGGFYHPGWGCGWRCGGPGWAERGWVGPAVVAGTVGAAMVAAPPYAPPEPVVQYSSVPPIGSVYPSLPGGCVLAPRNEINFYQCPGYRVRPLYGKNGLFYRVVPE
jgi:hypothetical protein